MRDEFGKIQTLLVKGYKSIKEINALELNEINIIIGQNGAGKSNFISLFKFLARLSREELQEYVTRQGGVNKILHFGPKNTELLKIYFRTDANQYECALFPTLDGKLAFADEKCSFLNAKRVISVPNQTETQLRRTSLAGRIPPYIYGGIENWRVYHFHDTSENAALRSSSTLTEPDRLAADGGNLAAFLYFLQENHPVNFTQILDTVKQIAPFIGQLVLQPEAFNSELIRLKWRHIGKDEVFDVSDLSDGTLRFIALTALLLQPNPPSTIVLDEPELGLHPAAISQLAALMHQVSPFIQIIAATQSPTFANHFGWEDFIIVERIDEASVFRRLNKEDVEPWIDDLPMGEIWEKNIVGGRP